MASGDSLQYILLGLASALDSYVKTKRRGEDRDEDQALRREQLNLQSLEADRRQRDREDRSADRKASLDHPRRLEIVFQEQDAQRDPPDQRGFQGTSATAARRFSTRASTNSRSDRRFR